MQKFFNCCVAHLSVKQNIKTKFPISYFGHAFLQFKTMDMFTVHDFSLIVSL